MKNKIIVIGAGKLGASIAKELSNRNEDVLVIDLNEVAFNKLDDFSGFTITGDATDLNVLEKYGVKDAKIIIITTDDDNVNLFLSHVCFYIYDVPQIHVRLSDSDKGKLIENTTIKAIYPFNLSLDYFFKAKESGPDESCDC